MQSNQSPSNSYPQLSPNSSRRKSHIKSLVSSHTSMGHNTNPRRPRGPRPKGPFRYYTLPDAVDSPGGTGSRNKFRATPVITETPVPETPVAEPIRLPSFKELLASIPFLSPLPDSTESKAAEETSSDDTLRDEKDPKNQMETALQLKDKMDRYYDALGCEPHDPEWSDSDVNVLKEATYQLKHAARHIRKFNGNRDQLFAELEKEKVVRMKAERLLKSLTGYEYTSTPAPLVWPNANGFHRKPLSSRRGADTDPAGSSNGSVVRRQRATPSHNEQVGPYPKGRVVQPTTAPR